ELIDLLPAEGFDVSLTGFEAPEIDLLLADMASSRPEPEDIPPALPRNPLTRSGDLWLLGKHRLLCGDARQAADFTRLMDGALAAAVFCDPPYNRRVREIGGRGAFAIPNLRSPPAKWLPPSSGRSSLKRSAMASASRPKGPCITSAWTGATSAI